MKTKATGISVSDGEPLAGLFFPPAPGFREERPQVQGRIPAFIQGEYYLNGPFDFRTDGRDYRNWLDGDGLARCMSFRDGEVVFRSRPIATQKRAQEKSAGSPIYRTFGTAFAGDRLRRGIALESPVNVSIYRHAGKVLAFGEQSLPWELDPATLETLGEFDFGGKFNDITPLSAHPKFDPVSDSSCNFGVKYNREGADLVVYDFDGMLSLRRKTKVPLGRPYYIHDFSLSRDYAVFHAGPYLLDLESFIGRSHAFLDSLVWRPELGGRLLAVSRAGGGLKADIDLGRTGYCLHLINSFTRTGLLFVDFIEAAEPFFTTYQPVPALFASPEPCSVRRVAIDIAAGKVVTSVAYPLHMHFDLPSMDPEKRGVHSGDFWALGISPSEGKAPKFFDQVFRFDWECGSPMDVYRMPEGFFLGGEPIFVGNADNAHEGAIICQASAPSFNQSEYLVFNAFDLAKGPLARIPLKTMEPMGIHAHFSPSRTGGKMPAVPD